MDENVRKERALLAQAETKNKVPFANSNGKPNKSDGSDTQVAKIKKDLTLTFEAQESTTSIQEECGQGMSRAQF